MSDFEKAVEIILDLEGGDKVIVDTGGLTKGGVFKNANPDIDIEKLTKKDAKQIYFDRYWEPCSAEDFKWPLNLFVFDAAVNQGVKVSKTLLQKAAGGLSVDGVIGRKTKARVASQDPDELGARYLARRAMRYFGTRAFDKYGYGWLSRLFRLTNRT